MSTGTASRGSQGASGASTEAGAVSMAASRGRSNVGAVRPSLTYSMADVLLDGELESRLMRYRSAGVGFADIARLFAQSGVTVHPGTARHWSIELGFEGPGDRAIRGMRAASPTSPSISDRAAANTSRDTRVSRSWVI